jgi:hypothetical protein
VESEVGRELLAHELKVKTVVVLGVERHDRKATAWVTLVDEEVVVFSMGKTGLIALRHPDGTLSDDTGPMHVYEYLGEI